MTEPLVYFRRSPEDGISGQMVVVVEDRSFIRPVDDGMAKNFLIDLVDIIGGKR